MRLRTLILLVGAESFAFAQPALQGLGASSYFCVDRDGDGYGTGPIKLGPYTDLAIDAVNPLLVTSAGRSFIAGDVGRVITITAGTGFIKGWYLITAVSSGAATLQQPAGWIASAGVLSSTGGSWVIYGCLGPDADDLDATVQTATQLLAASKFGTMQKALKSKGYAPLRIWLLDAGGSPTAASCTPATFESACLTAPRSTMPASIGAGDMIMVRANVNLRMDLAGYGVNGTSTNPIVVMGYPGETPNIVNTGSNQGIILTGRSWFVIDGFQTVGISAGDNNYTQNPHTFHDVIFRHLYGGPSGYQGLGPIAGGDNITIEDSVFANNNYGSSQAGLYIGCAWAAVCSNWTVQRNLGYNNAWDGLHWNGVGSNIVFNQNISHSNNISGFSFQSGMINSKVTSNLSFNNVSYQMLLYQYKDNDSSCVESGGSVPCGTGPSTGNLFQNNTLVDLTNSAYLGSKYSNAANGCFAVANHTPVNSYTNGPYFDMGSNTWRNNICVNWGDSSSPWRYAPIYFDGTPPSGYTGPIPTTYSQGYFSTSTFDHNVTKQMNGVNGGNGVFGVGQLGQGGMSAETVYDCASAQSLLTTGAITNCIVGDPKLAAAQRGYFWDPSLYDLRLLPASPALRSGSTTGLPAYDLAGRAYTASPGPSIGAMERQLYANGWVNLGISSGLRPAICPADGFGGSVCPAGISCGGTGAPYPYQSTCKSTIQSWSGAWARTKAGDEGLYLWGGGHRDGGSNAVYRLTFNTTAPAMARITDPSVIPNADFTIGYATMPDGRPTARHTYGQLAYIPTRDKMFAFAGSTFAGNGTHFSDTWWFDPVTLSWAAKDPVNASGFDPAGHNSGFVVQGSCNYDPSSDGVYCDNGGTMLAYDPANNKYYQAYTGFSDASPNSVIDWKRHQWLMFSDGKAFKTDITSAFASSLVITNIIGSIDASCTALVNSAAPGLIYNPVLDRIIGYPPNGGNTIYLMDPGTYTCTTQTFTGGPPNNDFGATQPGTYGRFGYFPSLDVIAVVNGYNQNAYVLNLNASDPSGPGGGQPTVINGRLSGAIR